MPEVKKELTDEPPVIRYTGTFDYEKLYKTIVSWYRNNGFDMHEKNYVHKGKELEFEWAGEKKITEYYQYGIEVSVFVWDMKDVEVIDEGEKKVIQHGRMQIIIKGAYTMDYKKQWEGSFKEKLRNIYHKYIIDKDIMFKIYAPLYKLVYGFYDEIRDVIGMEHT